MVQSILRLLLDIILVNLLDLLHIVIHGKTVCLIILCLKVRLVQRLLKRNDSQVLIVTGSLIWYASSPWRPRYIFTKLIEVSCTAIVLTVTIRKHQKLLMSDTRHIINVAYAQNAYVISIIICYFRITDTYFRVD